MNKPLYIDHVIGQFAQVKMVPVFFNADAEKAKRVVEICYNAGLRVFEFTNRGPQALQVFRQLVEFAASFDKLLLGAGTIMTHEEADAFADAGAHFLVSPYLNFAMKEVADVRQLPWIPGCGSVTEVVQAHQAGAALIKIFPAEVLGPAFLSSVLSVLPSVKLMPTGGVTPDAESLKSWFTAGAHCIGLGSQLLPSKSIQVGKWNEVEESVRRATSPPGPPSGGEGESL